MLNYFVKILSLVKHALNRIPISWNCIKILICRFNLYNFKILFYFCETFTRVELAKHDELFIHYIMLHLNLIQFVNCQVHGSIN